jgi:hypothetical protein
MTEALDRRTPLRAADVGNASFASDLVRLRNINLSGAIPVPRFGGEALTEDSFDFETVLPRIAYQEGRRQRPLTNDPDYDSPHDRVIKAQHDAKREAESHLKQLKDELEDAIGKRANKVYLQEDIDKRLEEDWGGVGKKAQAKGARLSDWLLQTEVKLRKFWKKHPELRASMPDKEPSRDMFWGIVLALFLLEATLNFLFFAGVASGDGVQPKGPSEGLIKLLLLPVTFGFINLLIAVPLGSAVHKLWPTKKGAAIGIATCAVLGAGLSAFTLAHVRQLMEHPVGSGPTDVLLSSAVGRIFSSQILDLGIAAFTLLFLTLGLFSFVFWKSQRTIDFVGPRYRELWRNRAKANEAFDHFIQEQVQQPAGTLLTQYRDAFTHLAKEIEESRNPVAGYVVKARQQYNVLTDRIEKLTEDVKFGIRQYRKLNIQARNGRRLFGLLPPNPTPPPRWFADDPGNKLVATRLIDNRDELTALSKQFEVEMKDRLGTVQTVVTKLSSKGEDLDSFCKRIRRALRQTALDQLNDDDLELFVKDPLNTADDSSPTDNTIPFPAERKR